MFEKLKNNEKICICTNSRNFIRNIQTKIDYKTKNKICLYYDGVKDYNLNLDEWDNADVIGYTPTITAGVSYEKHHFDYIFGYFTNTSSCAEMSIQQLFRVRNIEKKEMHICVDISGDNNYPVKEEEIEKNVLNKNTKLSIYCNTLKIDNYHKNIVKDEYYNLYINYIKIIIGIGIPKNHKSNERILFSYIVVYK